MLPCCEETKYMHISEGIYRSDIHINYQKIDKENICMV